MTAMISDPSPGTRLAATPRSTMTMTGPAYFTAFKNLEFTRTPSGVLTLRFHTDGGPATFTGQMRTDFPRALAEIGDDRDNRVLTAADLAQQQSISTEVIP